MRGMLRGLSGVSQIEADIFHTHTHPDAFMAILGTAVILIPVLE
jgi:hypothetical protein